LTRVQKHTVKHYPQNIEVLDILFMLQFLS
jgi:hypothetical protein